MATDIIPKDTKTDSEHVNFVCQRCKQPLKLDHSFNTLDNQLLGELAGKSNTSL